jgi:uncharacterized membrane protein YagU involved in acid resistance
MPEIIFWAGLIAGCIDLCAAFTFSAMRGTTPRRLLQAIASALIGPKSFAAGVSTVALGFALHFCIAFTVAGAYVIASRYFVALTDHWLLSGLLYGAAVHVFMTFVVLPLSRLKRPFSKAFFFVQLAIHMLCVGLPISAVVHLLSRAA